jgi:NADH:ubiquinone oxidoreductase subunit 6 (subunit J)
MTGGSMLFWIFAIATCGGALAVVVSQYVVRMAFWLIISLGSMAGLFFLLHADFVATTQLLVYVGGTVVLLIFGVMLTASGPYLQIKTSPAEGFLGAFVGILLLLMIGATVLQVDWTRAANISATVNGGSFSPGPVRGFNPETEGNTSRSIGMALLGVRPDKDLGSNSSGSNSSGSNSGRMSTGYLLPFEIVSVHLLVVLIGAAYLARAKRRVRDTPDPMAES